jgi:hypothetical protein
LPPSRTRGKSEGACTVPDPHGGRGRHRFTPTGDSQNPGTRVQGVRRGMPQSLRHETRMREPSIHEGQHDRKRHHSIAGSRKIPGRSWGRPGSGWAERQTGGSVAQLRGRQVPRHAPRHDDAPGREANRGGADDGAFVWTPCHSLRAQKPSRGASARIQALDCGGWRVAGGFRRVGQGPRRRSHRPGTGRRE